MADEYDPFKTDSGFKDDFDGEVTEAWFSTDPQYNSGKTLLFFVKVLADDGEEVENRYGTGSGWSSYDGGITAEHEKDAADRPKAFQNGTAYSEFFGTAMEAGAEDELRRRSREELQNQGPRNANLWKGLRFHWEVKTETRNIKDRDTQELKAVTTNRTLPVKFLGVAGGAGTGQGAGTQGVVPSPQSPTTPGMPLSTPGTAPLTTSPIPAAPSNAPEGSVPPIEQPGVIPQPMDAPAPAPAEPVPAQPANDFSYWTELPPELQVSVKASAVSSTYPEWVDAVLALPGAVAHGTLIQALSDENLYNALRTS